MIVQFCRSMARPHVPHDGTGDTCSRPRERFASCGHLPVSDVRGQRTGSESSERRRYRGQAEHLQVKLHSGRTIAFSPAGRHPLSLLRELKPTCVTGTEPIDIPARVKKKAISPRNESLSPSFLTAASLAWIQIAPRTALSEAYRASFFSSTGKNSLACPFKHAVCVYIRPRCFEAKYRGASSRSVPADSPQLATPHFICFLKPVGMTAADIRLLYFHILCTFPTFSEPVSVLQKNLIRPYSIGRFVI